MKKVDPDTVGAFMSMVLLAVLVVALLIFEPLLGMTLLTLVVVFVFGPYAIAWAWNRYVASEEENNE